MFSGCTVMVRVKLIVRGENAREILRCLAENQRITMNTVVEVKER